MENELFLCQHQIIETEGVIADHAICEVKRDKKDDLRMQMYIFRKSLFELLHCTLWYV